MTDWYSFHELEVLQTTPLHAIIDHLVYWICNFDLATLILGLKVTWKIYCAVVLYKSLFPATDIDPTNSGQLTA